MKPFPFLRQQLFLLLQAKKNFEVLLILCFGLFLFPWPVRAQVFDDTTFRQRAAAGLDQVYNLAFEKAELQFLLLQKDYPNHPAPDFLLALNRWWQTYLSENTPTYYAYIDARISEALRKNAAFEERPAYELEYTFFQYMCYAFRARLFILQKDYWQAVGAGRKALTYLKKGFAFTDQAPEFFFSSGIYHYYAAAYPKDHPIVRPFMLFFPDGNAELGIQQLELAANQPNFAQTEARFYLTEIYLHKEKALEQARRNARKLALQYPKNTWFQTDYAEALLATHNYGEAEKILTGLEQRFAAVSGHETHNISALESTLTSQLMMRVYHYLGRVYLAQQQAPERCRAHFRKSLQHADFAGITEHPLLPANHFYVGTCYDRAGMREEALTAYHLALRLPENEGLKSQIKACIQAPCLD